MSIEMCIRDSFLPGEQYNVAVEVQYLHLAAVYGVFHVAGEILSLIHI